MKELWSLLKETFEDWNEDKAPRLAAALAYYSVFSLAPILVIVVGVVGIVASGDEARAAIVDQLGGLVGNRDFIDGILSQGDDASSGIVATIIGVATLILGASGVFGQLQSALNTVWEVEPDPNRSIWATIRSRVLSFSMILVIAFILLTSLVLSTAIQLLSGWLAQYLPGGDFIALAANFLLSVVIITLLFAAMFKFLPDVDIDWGDVWLGALFTSLLFNIGRLLLSIYLGSNSTASTYGAAGSLVLLLLWVYYSAQILFFGAEFTQVYARRYGSRLLPSKDAIALTDEARATQGIARKEAKEKAARTGMSAAEAGSTPRQGSVVDNASDSRKQQTGRGKQAQATPVAAKTEVKKSPIMGFLVGLFFAYRERNRSRNRPKR